MAQNDFDINENDLDGEVLRQAALYNQWVGLAATASKQQKQIYLRRKILKAKLYKEAKEKFEQVGRKPTGADLESEVRTNPEYARVSQELIDAEEKYDIIDGGKWSMVEKGKSLERLCVDRDRGFFMASSINRSDSLKDVDVGLREGLQRKKIARG